MIKRAQAAGLLWPTLMTAVMLPVLLGLGTWQLARKTWKDNLQHQIDQRVAAPPVDWRALAERWRRGEPLEYTRVRLTGTFDHATERYLYWPLPEGSGWQVYTLFKPTGTEQALFVDRGWVPDTLRDPATRVAGQIAGETSITGLVRLQEVPGRFTLANEPRKNVWFWRDLTAMRASVQPATGTISATAVAMPSALDPPFSVDVEPEPANAGGWPRGGSTNTQLYNRHLDYAVTWYGLAVALTGIFFLFARGRLRESRSSRTPHDVYGE